MELPILGDLLGAGTSSSGGLLSLEGVTQSINSDPLGLVPTISGFQGMGAPLLAPLLVQAAPLIDLGPALPLLAPVLGGAGALPGLPSLDFLQ